MVSGRIPHMYPHHKLGGGVNESANDTMVNIVATLNREDNDQSMQEYEHPQQVAKDNRAVHMDNSGKRD